MLNTVVAAEPPVKRPNGRRKTADEFQAAVIYLRVSSPWQARSGLGMEAQEAACALAESPVRSKFQSKARERLPHDRVIQQKHLGKGFARRRRHQHGRAGAPAAAVAAAVGICVAAGSAGGAVAAVAAAIAAVAGVVAAAVGG